HLKSKDSDGITTLPNTGIFEQLTLMSPKKTAWEQFSINIATAIICLATNKTFNFSKMIFEGMGEGSIVPVESHHTPSGAPTTSQPLLSSPSRIPTRQETEVPQPNSPTYTNVVNEAAFISMDVVHGGAATIVSSKDAGQGSGKIPKSPTIPYDIPLLGGHTPGSDDGSMTLHELTVLCTTLSNKVDRLETELKKTKQIYGAALTKLIKKVKKLEQTVKTSQARRRAKIVVSDDEESSEDRNFLGYSYKEELLASETTEDVSNPSVADVDWDDVQAQIQADEDLAQRMLEEERETHQFKGYTFKEIEDIFKKTYKKIQSFVSIKSEATERTSEVKIGSSKRLAEEELQQESTKKQKTSEYELSKEDLQQMMMILPIEAMTVEALQTKYLIIDREVYIDERSRKYWKIVRIRNHTEVYKYFVNMLKIFDRDDLVKLWSLVKERFSSAEPSEDMERS
ncbi:hypothetical protein Tco_0688685, partial [Tanacetum coccineum]